MAFVFVALWIAFPAFMLWYVIGWFDAPRSAMGSTR